MLRFSIRDVLWLTVVVGIGIAWWMEHVKSQRDSRLLQESEQRAAILTTKMNQANSRAGSALSQWHKLQKQVEAQAKPPASEE